MTDEKTDDGAGLIGQVASPSAATLPRPIRVQRQRTKGWKMPANTVYVGRPTQWGNHFPVAKYGLTVALEYYRAFLTGEFVDAAATDYRKAEARFHGMGPATMYPSEIASIFLRGKNLACWCPLDQPCHADVLLEIANADHSLSEADLIAR